MAGVLGVPVKAFLVERPDRRRLPMKASLEPADPGGYGLMLKLPGGEKWWVERESLEFVLQAVRDHLEHVRSTT